MAAGNSGSKFAAFEIEVDQPARLKLLDKKRQPYRGNNGSEAWIELHSADSEIARKHRRAVQRKRLAMRGRGKLTPEELGGRGQRVIRCAHDWLGSGYHGCPVQSGECPRALRQQERPTHSRADRGVRV